VERNIRSTKAHFGSIFGSIVRERSKLTLQHVKLLSEMSNPPKRILTAFRQHCPREKQTNIAACQAAERNIKSAETHFGSILAALPARETSQRS
jgi:hypothetical protein